MKPRGKVKIEWSADFAYAIGLIVTDGCLYSDGRHINLTSKDEVQIKNFMRCLRLKAKIGKKASGSNPEKSCFVVQFGDVVFYQFLNSIGITSRKSKTIGAIDIPEEYFFDFLRGHFDGDGTFYSYWDPRWRSSFMFYLVFMSASKKHILWLRREISERLGIEGHITETGKTPMHQVKYAKADSLKLLPRLYYNTQVVCLPRKRRKIEKALAISDKILTN